MCTKFTAGRRSFAGPPFPAPHMTPRDSFTVICPVGNSQRFALRQNASDFQPMSQQRIQNSKPLVESATASPSESAAHSREFNMHTFIGRFQILALPPVPSGYQSFSGNPTCAWVELGSMQLEILQLAASIDSH